MYYHYLVAALLIVSSLLYKSEFLVEEFKALTIFPLLFIVSIGLTLIIATKRNWFLKRGKIGRGGRGRKKIKKVIWSIWLTFFIIIFFYSNSLYQVEDDNFPILSEDKKYVIEGEVVSVNNFKGNYYQIKLQLNKIRENGSLLWEWQRGDAKKFSLVNFNFKSSELSLSKVGNIISLEPYFIRNVIDFEKRLKNYRAYLLQENIKFISYAGNQKIKVIDTSTSVLGKVRYYIFQKLNFYLKDFSSSLGYGLITGDKSFISDEVKDTFRITGTYHVLAVSGMHAGIILAISFALLRLVSFRKKTIWLILALVLFPIYLFITDFQISIVRTYLMTLVLVALIFLDKTPDLKTSLILTFNLIILVMPQEIFTISFQLSFAAVWGIALILDFIKLFPKLNWISKFLLVSLGAQMANMGVLIYHFGYFNFLTIFYNFLVSFSIPLIMIYCIFIVLSPFPGLNVFIARTVDFIAAATLRGLDKFKFNSESFLYADWVSNIWLAFICLLVYSSAVYFLIWLTRKLKNDNN